MRLGHILFRAAYLAYMRYMLDGFWLNAYLALPLLVLALGKLGFHLLQIASLTGIKESLATSLQPTHIHHICLFNCCPYLAVVLRACMAPSLLRFAALR